MTDQIAALEIEGNPFQIRLYCRH